VQAISSLKILRGRSGWQKEKRDWFGGSIQICGDDK